MTSLNLLHSGLVQ